MGSFVRHCVECPKCRTRYLIGFSPYKNGSRFVRVRGKTVDEYLLRCSCSAPPALSRWKESEIKRYRVSKAAHTQHYGTVEEVRLLPAAAKNESLEVEEPQKVLTNHLGFALQR
jgi:hypothetical protein